MISFLKERTRFITKNIFISLLILCFAVTVLAAGWSFSDTVPRYYKWVAPRSIEVRAERQYTLWINAPSGFQIQIVNESTGDYAGFVSQGGETSVGYTLSSGSYALVVDSGDVPGTFECGLK